MKHGAAVVPRYSAIMRLSGIFFGSLVLTVIFILTVWNISAFLRKSGFKLQANLSMFQLMQQRNQLFQSSGARTTQNISWYDPNDLRQQLDKKSSDFVLVDLRTTEAFNKNHIKDAISIPYTAESELIKKLQTYKKKEIIMYGDSSFSVSPRKAVEFLNSKGYSAHVLTVGWNEWRHFKTIWLPESEWNAIDMQRYIEEVEN